MPDRQPIPVVATQSEKVNLGATIYTAIVATMIAAFAGWIAWSVNIKFQNERYTSDIKYASREQLEEMKTNVNASLEKHSYEIYDLKSHVANMDKEMGSTIRTRP